MSERSFATDRGSGIWKRGIAGLVLLLLVAFAPCPPVAAATLTRSPAFAGPDGGAGHPALAGQSAAMLSLQFAETSYYLKDIDFVSAAAGWAVGHPHWDQARKAPAGTIVKTADGGLTWMPQSVPVVETLRNVDFIDSSNGWAVGENGVILHTVDGGAHWTQQSTGVTDEFRGVVFVNASQGWATSFRAIHYDYNGDPDDWRGRIWHTTDGGQTWQPQSLPANASLLNRITFIDAQHGWAVGIKATGADPDHPEHAGVVYRTTDGGQTWQEFYSPGPNITLNGVEWIDSNHGWVVGFPNLSNMTGGFVFHTADGGQTWQRQTPGDFFSPLWDVQFIDANRGYVVGFNYIGAWGPPVYRTLDGGATWQAIRMELHEADGLFGVAVSEDRVIAVGDHDYLVHSARPWDSYEPSCPDGTCLFTQTYLNTHYVFHDVAFTDEANGWAVGAQQNTPEVWGQVILRTTDGGATWSPNHQLWPLDATIFNHFRLNSVFFVDARNGWAVGSSVKVADGPAEYHGGIWRTTDGGQTWHEQGLELYNQRSLEFFDVQFLDERHGWVLLAHYVTSSNIFLAHTVDGGEHWQLVDTGVTGPLAVGFADPFGGVVFTDAQRGLAFGGLSRVAMTHDGGATWTEPVVSCGGPNPCRWALYAGAFRDSRAGWLAGEGAWPTADGGATWRHQDMPLHGRTQAIEFLDGQRGWLVTDRGEMAYTSTGGARWRRLDANAGVALRGLDFANARQGWFVGDSGVILHYAGDRLPVTDEALLPFVKR